MQEGLTTLGFVRARRHLPAARWQAHIVYALRGEAQALSGETSWALSRDQGAILIANPGEDVELAPGPQTLLAVVNLDLHQLRRTLNDRSVVFSCNPTMRHQASYGELTHCLDALLRARTETGDFAGLRASVAEMNLIRCLLDGFGGTVSLAPSRAEAFASYLDLHYDEPLTLAQTARHFHLSTEHFAKVFKAEVGETFHAYLTRVRLDSAIRQLDRGAQTISRIALEAGFPNTAAFNQAFKERLGVTPSHYRREHRVPAQELPASVARELQSLSPAQEAEALDVLAIDINAQSTLDPLHESWRDMIGIGHLESLADARVREQVLTLQRNLRFQRCRVGCNFGAYANSLDSYQIDSCFDFLVGNRIVPHVIVLRDGRLGTDEYLAAFSQALRRFANRYSVQTLRTWRFEVVLQAGESPEPLDQAGESPEPLDAYLDFFERAAAVLQPYGMNHDLAGPGILPDHDASNLRALLRESARRNTRFGAVTIACRPGTASADTPLVRTADRLYLRNQVLLAREVLVDEGYDPDLLVVDSWRDSLETHNIMNDSCYEGASIMQTVLSAWDLVGSLCYNDALDLSPTSSSGDAFLSGLPGLISRDGIPKPSYYAFEFLGHINRHLIYADEHCLSSTNDMGNYQVVCHNCERLNAAYLATPEPLLDYQLIDTYFEQQRDRMLRLRITNAQPGTYLVKMRMVNEDGGSVGNEAVRMRLWCMDEPSRSEISHLKAASQPQMQLERIHTSDGTISIEHVLKSNEIVYLHIIYLY